MTQFRPLALIFPLVLAACQSGLSRNEPRLLAEGYRKLSPSAYVREDPDGHPRSFQAEGDLGWAVVLTYMRDKERELRREVDRRRARGLEDQMSRDLERELQATERHLEYLIQASR